MPTIRISEFDTWRPGYGFATVRILRAGTSTLADVFTDEALTAVAANPQTLLNLTAGAIAYGRFAAPLYTEQAYELEINDVDRTGVTRPPLTTLVGENASDALVTVTGGSKAVALDDRFARIIDVRDFGNFVAVGGDGASASTNNATLTSAIGAAGAAGGAFVEIPAGTYQFTALTLPLGVILRGQGRDITILQSTQAGEVVTISGEQAGLCRLTVDGISQVGGSVGVYAEAIDHIVMNDAKVKRFETGIWLKGGSRCRWIELHVSDCVTGYKAHADAAGGDGGPLQFNEWHGGAVELCSTVGIELKNVDEPCDHNLFAGIKFDTNTGIAFHVIGARATTIRDGQWVENTNNLTVEDGTPETTENTIVGLELMGGSMDEGDIDLTGNLEAVAFRRVEFTDVTIALDTPTNNVLAEDCREISGLTIEGNTPTAWVRKKSFDGGASSGLTTGNVATKAWGIHLQPGQRVFLIATVIGRGRNVAQDGFYYLAVSARRPGASLAYDSQTGNFTAGNIVTGQTSGASARIAADSDSGTTGTLTLQDIVGEFEDNEIITDTGTGSATANGAMSFSNAELAGSVSALRAAQETNANWAATIAANGPEIEVQVTGDTSQTVEWTVDVEVKSS